MELVIIFGLVGLFVNRAVDFLRNAFDKNDRVPKAYWLLAAWGVGILVALLTCNVAPLAHLLNVSGSSCVNTVVAGLGFGSVAGFWHEVLDALSSLSGPSSTPKGLKIGG